MHKYNYTHTFKIIHAFMFTYICTRVCTQMHK